MTLSLRLCGGGDSKGDTMTSDARSAHWPWPMQEIRLRLPHHSSSASMDAWYVERRKDVGHQLTQKEMGICE